jgi:competence protein ComEC
MADRLQAAVPGDTGALLAGLVTGDDGALSDNRHRAFIATGTTHITAVSGSNIALVVVLAVPFGGAAGLNRKFAWQVVTILSVWVYDLLVGLQPPAFRAALVAGAAILAVRFGRRADIVTLIVLAAGVELLVRPVDYWTLSFRLSFASSLALSLVLRGASFEGVRGYARSAFLATASAQLAATPLLISSVGNLSPLSLPTNLLIAPFVAIAFPLAALAAVIGSVSTAAGAIVAAPAGVSALVVIRIVDLFGGPVGFNPAQGAVGLGDNLLVAGISYAAIAAMSADCRCVVSRAFAWSGTVGRRRKMAVAAVGGGFVVGLIVAAIR